MMLSMEYIEKILKENELLNENSSFFYGTTLPKMIDYAAFGVLASLEATRVILALHNNELYFIPCSGFNNDALIDKKVVINKDSISKVVFGKGSIGWYELKFLNENNEEIIGINFQIRDIEQEKFKSNLLKFMRQFNNEGIEKIEEVKTKNQKPNIAIILLALIMLIIGIFAIIKTEYEIGLILIVISLICGFVLGTKKK